MEAGIATLGRVCAKRLEIDQDGTGTSLGCFTIKVVQVIKGSGNTSDSKAQFSLGLPFGSFNPAMEYMIDAGQRTLLFWDVMRQRGEQYEEHLKQVVPNVLSYQPEL